MLNFIKCVFFGTSAFYSQDFLNSAGYIVPGIFAFLVCFVLSTVYLLRASDELEKSKGENK